MSKLLASNYRFRKSFAKNLPAMDFDNLIAVQLRSFNDFLQSGVKPSSRDKNVGLESVFHSIFPIQDFKKE